MSGADTMALADIFVILLVALALVALISRRFPVPYTATLVLVGLLVAVAVPRTAISVTPELVLAVLVPGLVFEAAFRLDFDQLRPTLPAVSVLALPGVLIVAGLVAVVLHLAVGLPLEGAFLVGAMVSATDPVAVITTMRQAHAPERLATLVEGESLFNDGTGIVLFTIALAGGDVLVGGLASFCVIVVVSIALGLVLGGLAAWIGSRIDDVNIELTLTLVAAYGVYLLADDLHQSGIIATVVGGIVIGTYGRHAGMSARTRVAIDTVWGYLAFVLTALVFLLIGLTITPDVLIDAAVPIAWGVVAVIAGRLVVVYGLLRGLGRIPLGERLGLRLLLAWSHVLFWSGLRGAIAVALALSLPAETPDRALLQGIVFGIVLFTLLVQGTTAGQMISLADPRAREPTALGAGARTS
ncbi:MAG: cation:proton antiporter [Candidatus Limnocylindrales bacterium]